MADKTLPDSESARDRLLPCPFCGVRLTDHHDPSGKWIWSTHPSNECLMSEQREGEGIVVKCWDAEAWNRRAESARIQELEKRLECNHAFQLIDGKLQRVEMQLGPDCDGIAARDATIELQDQYIVEQSARITKLEGDLVKLEKAMGLVRFRRALTEGK